MLAIVPRVPRPRPTSSDGRNRTGRTKEHAVSPSFAAIDQPFPHCANKKPLQDCGSREEMQEQARHCAHSRSDVGALMSTTLICLERPRRHYVARHQPRIYPLLRFIHAQNHHPPQPSMRLFPENLKSPPIFGHLHHLTPSPLLSPYPRITFSISSSTTFSAPSSQTSALLSSLPETQTPAP